MLYQGSLVHARHSLGGATAFQQTESDFLTERANWASQNRACCKVQPSFSEKKEIMIIGVQILKVRIP